MSRIRQLISSCLLILSIAASGLARDWRGIIPLRSTRADVERLLGPQLTPPDPDDTKIYNLNSSWAIYFLPEGEIWFNFVDPKAEEPNCMGNLPLGTVLSISIRPSRTLKLTDIGLDEKKIFNASNLKQLNFKGYLDATGGFAVVLERGHIYKIQYFGQAKDKRLCPPYFHNLKKQFVWIEMYFDYIPDP